MHVRSKWTPRGIALWLIAAIVATLAVWSQTRPEDPPSEASVDVEIVD